MEEICIWCRYSQPKVTFVRKAHIFPRSLGGKRLCTNVCDACNSYFGSKQQGLTSVEIALKEPLNISRQYLLSEVLKNKNIPRFKSEYFDYDLQKQLIQPKYKYRNAAFGNTFTKQFKRGIYKIFLEERSESKGDALDARFDFIREFARYGLGDYPVFYCRPTAPAIFFSLPDIKEPVIRFTDHSDKVMQEFGFYSYFFLTHTITFPTIRTYELTLSNYIEYFLKSENSQFDQMFPLRSITDIDFIFSFANP